MATGAPQREWVAVAALTRAWGRSGELSAVPLSSRPERYEQLRDVYLFDSAGNLLSEDPFQIERVWQHRERLILKFCGIDSISDAERIEGAEVRIPKEDRAQLPDGEYYQSDLVGCEVIDRASGQPIGRVTGVQQYGGPELLAIEGASDGREILVPFARSICVEVDVNSRRIVVDLPEGLLDLSG